MIELSQCHNKIIGVLGLGKSGLAAIKALNAAKAKIIAWDDNQDLRNQLINDLQYGYLDFTHNLHDPTSKAWGEVEFLLLSPGIRLYHQPHRIVTLMHKLNKQIICDIELLYQTHYTQNASTIQVREREIEEQRGSNLLGEHPSSQSSTPHQLDLRGTYQAKFIGITGSNGKSTTSALISHILTQHQINNKLGGNIGIPVLALDHADNYVLELSSYQLDLLAYSRFDIAILLNITPDHIEHHGSLTNYINAKAKIFNHRKLGDINIIGVDSILGNNLYQNLKDKLDFIAISTEQILDHGVSIIDDHIYYNIGSEKKKFYLGLTPYLAGKHNQENIAAAFTACMSYQISAELIINYIKSFKGLPHRLQLVRQINNITYVNDSKATNQEATSRALASFSNIYWIVGGMAKEGGINDLACYFHKIHHAFLIGKSEHDFANIMQQHHLAYTKCHNLEQALAQAITMAQSDKNQAVILLSPACASFDQWRNFEARGEWFCQYVKNL